MDPDRDFEDATRNGRLLATINRVECCPELLQEGKTDLSKFFDRIITGDESWIYHYDTLTQHETKIWKNSGEQTPSRPHQQKSAGKVMMIIFWDKNGILLTEFIAFKP